MLNLNIVSKLLNNSFILKVILGALLLLLLPQVSFSSEANNQIVSKNGIVAYTWNANPSAESSTLSTSLYTFNNGHSVTRNRASTGVYKVKFEGLTCNRGQFIVNAYGGTEFKSCRIGSWNGKENCEVSVYCFNAKGAPLDSQFNLLFID